MKAAVYERYGPPEVVFVRDVPTPTPGANEVLIKVRATTVTRGDIRMRAFRVPLLMWIPARLYLGVRTPRRAILGMELAGDIAAVGANVTRYKVGDPVFASTFETRFGAHAQYKCLPEDGELLPKPANVSYAEAAAAVGGGMMALRCLHQADIQPGQSVLIYGASGAVGTCAVQIAARHFGAEVTGVCSGRNLELMQGLGAAHVIDYTQQDFTTTGARYDVVFDAVAKFPPARAKSALKPGGVYLNAHKHSDNDGKNTVRIAELQAVADLLAAGALKPVIDRTYPLAEIAEAHRYVDSERKRGNVAISIPHDD